MKRLLFAILTLTSITLGSRAEQFFDLPKPPASLETLRERTNYLVEHFWERCPMKSAFAHKANMEEAFRIYVSFMPHASADTVHSSINALIDQVKKDPKNLLTLGQIAESALYGDSAEVFSDEVYLPFAKAVASCKKIPQAQRARFAHHAKVLEFSQIGAILNDIPMTLPDGTKTSLSAVEAPYTLLFVNDPDCDDCRLTRVRLAADANARRLISDGQLAIVSVLPDEPSDEWRENVANYPTDWIVGASPEIDELIDLRHPPVMYFLDADKKVIAKNLLTDNVLNALSLMK